MQILFVVVQARLIIVDELRRLLVLVFAFRSAEQSKEDRQANDLK